MTTLGVFRDDFYNPIYVLPAAQYTATTQTSGTLLASAMAGGLITVVQSSAATALTTDTAANIIAYLKNVVAIQLAAIGIEQGPPFGVPDVTSGRVSYLLWINNQDASTLTLSAGTGVTITGTATIATTLTRKYLVTITGPSAVTIQNLGV